MSVEFTMQRISKRLIHDFKIWGKLAFEVFWASNILDDDIEDMTALADYLFSGGITDFPYPFSNEIYEIVQESQKLYESSEDTLSSDGNYIQGINFILTGRRKFNELDFLIQEIHHLGHSEPILLVSALFGCRKIKEELGIFVSYLSQSDVQTLLTPLEEILNDDFDFRWNLFQEYLNHVFAYSPNNKCVQPNIFSKVSFSEFFDFPDEPKKLIQDELVPFLGKTAKDGKGLLVTYCY